MQFLFDFFYNSILNIPLYYFFYYYHKNVINNIKNQYNANFVIMVEKFAELDSSINSINSKINENNQNINKLFQNNLEDRQNINSLLVLDLDKSLNDYDDYIHS